MLTAEQEKTKGQFKFCQRCGLYMIKSFDGCPHCQTDKYIINADYGKGKTLNEKRPRHFARERDCMMNYDEAIKALEKAKSYKALTGFPIDDDIIEAFESVINYPTLNDAIKVVEDLFAREIKRFHNRIDSQYSKSWETTTTKIVLAYVVNLQIEFLEALKWLKERE